MRGPRSEKIRLLHMRDAADRILREYAALNGERLNDDDLRYHGLLRLVGIIGEAAYKLTPELRTAHPEVPWKQIIGTRHFIVHEYDNVDENRFWDIIAHSLPALRQQLQHILDTLPE